MKLKISEPGEIDAAECGLLCSRELDINLCEKFGLQRKALLFFDKPVIITIYLLNELKMSRYYYI
jgi:hypothetical protein